MNNPIPSIDISHNSELSRIAAEVELTRKPQELKRDNKTVAVIMPVAPVKEHNQKAIDETLALAGSWSDLDFDSMLETLDHIRHASKPTPPIDLDI